MSTAGLTIISSGLDAALAAASQRALRYEMEIKDLEASSSADPLFASMFSCGPFHVHHRQDSRRASAIRA